MKGSPKGKLRLHQLQFLTTTMGNQVSLCSASTAAAATEGSTASPIALEPCAVAKVLLLDGQVLHFTESVKAIHVLLQHPNHCLCPAQSLHFMAHSPSPPTPCSLLPDDELQVGHIYLLLPLHSFLHLEHASGAAAPASDHLHNYINSTTSPALAHPPAAKLALASKHLSFIKRGRPSAVSLNQSEPTNVTHSNSEPNNLKLINADSDMQDGLSSPSTAASLRRRSFELRRPYKGVNIRRCRSWRPRLQAITEVNTW